LDRTLKSLALVILTVFMTAACSSSNTDSAMLDPAVVQTESEAIDMERVIEASLSVINTELLKQAIDNTPTVSVENSFAVVEPDAPSVMTFACPISGTASIENGNREFRI